MTEPLINTRGKKENVRVAKMILEEVRDKLRVAGIVHTEKQFCEMWLGKSECYMRFLRFSDATPSADALATCASRLAETARQLRAYGKQRHNAWAEELEQLRVECYVVMDKQAQAKLQRKGVCM